MKIPLIFTILMSLLVYQANGSVLSDELFSQEDSSCCQTSNDCCCSAESLCCGDDGRVIIDSPIATISSITISTPLLPVEIVCISLTKEKVRESFFGFPVSKAPPASKVSRENIQIWII